MYGMGCLSLGCIFGKKKKKKTHVRLDHRDSLQDPRFLAVGTQSTDYQLI
jgi:hypothetical protein